MSQPSKKDQTLLFFIVLAAMVAVASARVATETQGPKQT
jgi:hypothetical protein